MEKPPFSTIADHELIGLIGSGSYGEVWLARSQLETFRAIKIVRLSKFDNPRPFKREYDGIKKFEPISRIHRGLTNVLQAGKGQDDSYFYYIMEVADDISTGSKIDPESYCPRTLASELQQKGHLPIEECVKIGVELASALAFLHEKDLLHRDIKPSNIIFIDGRPKLADIGLVTDVNSANTYVGTDGYIPPEGPNSPQADIFSLGKLLYEISTGKDRQDFPALPNQAGFSPEFMELNEVLLTACHTDVRKRYSSASEMTADLKLIATGGSVRRLHQLESIFGVVKKWGAVAVVLFAVLAAIFSQIQKDRQREQQEKERLIGTKVAQGTVLLTQGNLLGSLPFLTEALQLDESNKSTEETHRLRIGSILNASPTISRSWFLTNAPLMWCDVHERLMAVTVQHAYCQVVDLATGQALSKPLGGEWKTESATFSPDGNTLILASWGDDAVRVLDWKTGKELLHLNHPRGVLYAASSPDGNTIIAACRDKIAYLWDQKTGASKGQLKGHDDQVSYVKFSPTGRWAVTAGNDGKAIVWDLKTNQPLWPPFLHQNWIYCADFSPDEHLLATASFDRKVKLWDLDSGRELLPSLGHDDGVCSVQFSGDGNFILTGCLDRSARIWSTSTHGPIEINSKINQTNRLMGAVYAAKGNNIITYGSDGKLTLWDFHPESTKPVHIGMIPLKQRKNQIVSSDEHWQATIGIDRLDIERLQPDRKVKIALSGQFTNVIFTGQSDKALAVRKATLYLIDLQSGKTNSFTHDYPITYAEFSPDGTKIVCASFDTTLDELAARILDTRTCLPIGPLLQHKDGILFTTFSSDSRRVVTTGEDFSAVVWDANSGKRITQDLKHHNKVHHAQFAETKPWLVTACEDGTAMIWDSETGDPITPPFKHAQPVISARFVDNDTAILTVDTLGNEWKWPLRVDRRSVKELTALAAELSGDNSWKNH